MTKKDNIFYYDSKKDVGFDEYYFIKLKNGYELIYDICLIRSFFNSNCLDLVDKRGKILFRMQADDPNTLDLFYVLVRLETIENLDKKDKELVIDYCNRFIKHEGMLSVFLTLQK